MKMEDKIISISPSFSEIIETESGETYRRCSPDNWEMLMGESWEPIYFYREEKLERMYQTYKKGIE